MAKANAAVTVVADICLYGNRETGAGFIAQAVDGRMFGNGEPLASRSFTEAVWLAVDELRRAGVERGQLRIFAPGGERMATVEIGGLKDRRLPYFGELSWGPAPVYVISAEALVAASEEGGR